MYIEEIPAKPKPKKVLRVVAYARVSSDKDAAFHSLEAQQEYYQEYVANHPGWNLVGIYSDNGISGTTMERPEFQKMLEDCQNGKIDLVITKSVTRFARNTVVLLDTVRKLKTLGVDCYFEKENLHSISSDGELLLTLLAMYAEEEARSTSENQRWRIKKRFEQGKPWVGNMFGYRFIDGEMVVIDEEAEIVQRIFQCYLSGMGPQRIARILNEQAAASPTRCLWTVTAIRKMLRNEKYKGDMLLQKTFISDFRTKKSSVNRGELPKYYVRNSHAPIIEPAVFDLVQQEIEQRKKKYYDTLQRNEGHSNEGSIFKGLIVCGCCGYKYVRKYTNLKKYDKPIWICNNYFKRGITGCQSKRIPETILVEKTEEVLGTELLTREYIMNHIDRIVIPKHNHLLYQFKDGSEADVSWEYSSRRYSWTPEMREEARKRAKKQSKERSMRNGNKTGN